MQQQSNPLVEQLKRFALTEFNKDEVKQAVSQYRESKWPSVYVNAERHQPYTPHHEDERLWVESDVPRYLLARGGEGSGKSTAAIIKTLERLRRGMSGILVSPTLPHFTVSLWPEFRRWCPWDQAMPKHQKYQKPTWEPYKSQFQINFTNGAVLYCGGIDNPTSWEGPNVNFACFDEARRKDKPDALKVLDGRVRIPGPQQEPPQIWIATTPRKNWLYQYFGPLHCVCQECHTEYDWNPDGTTPTCPDCNSTSYTTEDPKAAFKLDALVIRMFTEDNEPNLEQGFSARRAQTLTPIEQRVYLEGAWEDAESAQPFLPNPQLWDNCQEKLPPLTPKEPLVVALDSAKGRTTEYSDCVALVGVTRHPDRDRHEDIAVRLIYKWQSAPGQQIDLQGTKGNPGLEPTLRDLCSKYNVIIVPYDPYQLNDMAVRLKRERVAWMFEFSQGARRSKADTDLLQLIVENRVVHSGNADLRSHITNADRKTSSEGSKLRIVKREESLKVDLAVALSMACHECLRLNI
ncbi:MAG: hypothetical protein GF350_12385 [Chitinivibrionales bacterium]|nr:hypothetical protein [Chitinivibrionales bacterium]